MESFNFLGSRLNEIIGLLQTGKKINAIKVYREVTGSSLAEAKTAIERMELAIGMYGAQALGEALSKSAPQTNMTEMDPQNMLLDEIALLIAKGKKIQAITLYRERTGLGLGDAKAAIEHMEATIRMGGTLAIGEALSGTAPQVNKMQMEDSQSVLFAEIARLVANRQKIEAIKLYCEKTGLGLANAKRTVDRIEQQMRTGF